MPTDRKLGPDGRLIDGECGDRARDTLERWLARLERWSVRPFCTDDHAPYAQAWPVGRRDFGKDETLMSERANALFAHSHCNQSKYSNNVT